jgi:hypothetical protein
MKNRIRKPDEGEIELILAECVLYWIFILQERGLIK